MIIKSYKKIILPEQRNPKITQIILNKADSITPSLVLFYFNQQCSSSGNENENSILWKSWIIYLCQVWFHVCVLQSMPFSYWLWNFLTFVHVKSFLFPICFIVIMDLFNNIITSRQIKKDNDQIEPTLLPR